MNGKQKCRILKDIRREIAAENDIALVIEECTHKGECRGTCPRCEAEVRMLEQELQRRSALGRRVALAGVSAGMALALTGCAVVDAALVCLALPTPVQTPEIEPLSGMVEPTPTEDPGEIEILDGEVPYEYFAGEQ